MDKTKTTTLNGKICKIVLKRSILEQVPIYSLYVPISGITDNRRCAARISEEFRKAGIRG